MLLYIESFTECSLLGLYEWSLEVDKFVYLLGLKYNIRDGDKLWTAVETPEPICDVINEEKSDGNSEGLKFGLTEGVTLIRFDITILGPDDFSKLGEDIGFTLIEG